MWTPELRAEVARAVDDIKPDVVKHAIEAYNRRTLQALEELPNAQRSRASDVDGPTHYAPHELRHLLGHVGPGRQPMAALAQERRPSSPGWVEQSRASRDPHAAIGLAVQGRRSVLLASERAVETQGATDSERHSHWAKQVAAISRGHSSAAWADMLACLAHFGQAGS